MKPAWTGPHHYSTNVAAIIASRDVASRAAKDCALFLWATMPMLEAALQAMKAWGFEYKSQFVWIKDRIGTGYWNRNKHEILLVGTRGNPPAPEMGTQFDSTIEAAVREHSRKPDSPTRSSSAISRMCSNSSATPAVRRDLDGGSGA